MLLDRFLGHTKALILDPIRAIFHDLGQKRHFALDLDLQDEARDWPDGLGTAQTFLFQLSSTPSIKQAFFFRRSAPR